MGEVYDAKNRPVMAALELNPTSAKGSTLDFIKIATAQGRKNVQNLLETSKILHWNKNKSRVNDWLKVNRLQLPLPNSQSDSANKSVSHSPDKVNTQKQETKKKLPRRRTKPRQPMPRSCGTSRSQTYEFSDLLKSGEFIGHEDDDGRHPDAVRGWNKYRLHFLVPTNEGKFSAYRGEIKIKLIARGDCFYDITKIENITDGTDGQALIKAAISADDVSNISIPDSVEKINHTGENSEKISRSISSRIVFGTPANTVGVKERAKGVIEKVKGIATDNTYFDTKSAKHISSTLHVNHKKFVQFHYYAVNTVYNGSIYNLWINVGTAKNDGMNHIYSITKREETSTNNGVSRPVGNAIQNASSDNSVSRSPENVNNQNAEPAKSTPSTSTSSQTRTEASSTVQSRA